VAKPAKTTMMIAAAPAAVAELPGDDELARRLALDDLAAGVAFQLEPRPRAGRR
jgi:hypothetical protein